MKAPTFASYIKDLQANATAADNDAACTQLALIRDLLALAQCGIADDPSEVRVRIAKALRSMSVVLCRVGLNEADRVIKPTRWTHRPPDTSKAAWLEATARFITHAEKLADLTLNTFAGRNPLKGSAVILLTRMSGVIDDLLLFTGAYKLSLRECAEGGVS